MYGSFDKTWHPGGVDFDKNRWQNVKIPNPARPPSPRDSIDRCIIKTKWIYFIRLHILMELSGCSAQVKRHFIQLPHSWYICYFSGFPRIGKFWRFTWIFFKEHRQKKYILGRFQWLRLQRGSGRTWGEFKNNTESSKHPTEETWQFLDFFLWIWEG